MKIKKTYSEKLLNSLLEEFEFYKNKLRYEVIESINRLK